MPKKKENPPTNVNQIFTENVIEENENEVTIKRVYNVDVTEVDNFNTAKVVKAGTEVIFKRRK